MAELPVVDASPFIFLAKTGLLELLRPEGDAVLVPDAVAREIRDHAIDLAIEALDRNPWVRITPAQEIPASILAWDLGAGESAVLAWAHAIFADLTRQEESLDLLSRPDIGFRRSWEALLAARGLVIDSNQIVKLPSPASFEQSASNGLHDVAL